MGNCLDCCCPQTTPDYREQRDERFVSLPPRQDADSSIDALATQPTPTYSTFEPAPPLNSQTETVDQNILRISGEISSIKSEVDFFAERNEAFSGTATSDEYHYIYESLTRLLLRLDALNIADSNDLRLQRREVIKYINKIHNDLEEKAGVKPQ